jgi:hypothetical protein
MLRVVERVLNADPDRASHPLSINLDGAIAAICGDLGFDPEIANGVFIIARVPGLLAHAAEERSREAPMRQVDARHHRYDGPARRRLPETRKQAGDPVPRLPERPHVLVQPQPYDGSCPKPGHSRARSGVCLDGASRRRAVVG